MEPSRSSAQRGCTRMPVDMASGEPASTAWRNPTSAPSGCTSAQANGWSSGCFGGFAHPGPGQHGAARTDLDQLGELVAGQRVVLGGRDEHPAVGAPDPQQHLLAQAGEEGTDDRARRAENGYSMMRGALRTPESSATASTRRR